MKIFLEETGYWQNKVNFVDQNDVFLGYDLTQNCCEEAGWFISDTIEDTALLDIASHEGDLKYVHIYNEFLKEYVFDTKFYLEHPHPGTDFTIVDEDCNMAIFRIFNGESEKYIHLFNIHNGYYSHGFDFSINDKVIKSERL